MSILDRAIALCVKDADTYRVPLPTEDEVEFRHVSGPDEVTRLETDAAKLVDKIRKAEMPKDIMSIGVRDPVTIMQAHFLDKLYVASWRRSDLPAEDGKYVFEQEPERPAFGHWLTMAAKVPFAFRTLWSRVDDEITGRNALARREALGEAKKEWSSEDESGLMNSEPPETAGDSTLDS